MADKIELEIVTPEGQVFSGKVDGVTIPGSVGYLGILPGHAPLVTELKIGVISCQADNSESRLFCAWGFAEILGNKVSILADQVEKPEDIDVEAARADKVRAQSILDAKADDSDFQEAVNLLDAANARLEVAGKTIK